ncbi:MAG: WD40 repeat domain-containing protein [Planctomycetes bacterium]|nr:WD40 repeat domain-containing protein [Planctomycetota bacterium]
MAMRRARAWWVLLGPVLACGLGLVVAGCQALHKWWYEDHGVIRDRQGRLYYLHPGPGPQLNDFRERILWAYRTQVIDTGAYDMEYTPDGRYLVITGPGGIEIVDAHTALFDSHSNGDMPGGDSLSIHPSGECLALGGNGGVRVYGFPDLKPLTEFVLDGVDMSMYPHGGPGVYLTFSPDGKWLAAQVADIHREYSFLYEVPSWRFVRRVHTDRGKGFSIGDVLFSSDSRETIVFEHQRIRPKNDAWTDEDFRLTGEARFYDVESGRHTRSYRGPDSNKYFGTVPGFCFPRDGRFAIGTVAKSPERNWEIAIWYPDRPYDPDIYPNPAIRSGDETPEGFVRASFYASIREVTPDGRILVMWERDFGLWDVERKQTFFRTRLSGECKKVAISPDSKTCAAFYGWSTVVFYDITPEKELVGEGDPRDGR